MKNLNFRLAKVLSALMVVGTYTNASELSFYFSNDSLNGFKLSDAYETHDMGIKYGTASHWYDLNLGIVSPDMYVYRNQYREANRSYGEIISVSYGSNQTGGFCTLSQVGQFGLDKVQDFAHRIFQLQPISKINYLVRMPNETHFGCGISYDLNNQSTRTITSYLGSDRSFISAGIQTPVIKHSNFDISSTLGITLIGHDHIVSAKPISANIRHLIPHWDMRLNYRLNNAVTVSISEKFSLPTIDSDNKAFIQFFASVMFSIE